MGTLFVFLDGLRIRFKNLVTIHSVADVATGERFRKLPADEHKSIDLRRQRDCANYFLTLANGGFVNRGHCVFVFGRFQIAELSGL